MSLTFGLLGPLEIWTSDGQVMPLRGKARALLAMLLLRVNQQVATDVIIQGLWDEPPKAARESVQFFVHQLRKAVGESGARRTGGLLETHGASYLLRAERAQIDIGQLERLLEQARSERDKGALPEAWARYGDALRLWRGPTLADFTQYPFAQSGIVRLEALRLACVQERLRTGLELGWHSELAGELEAATTEHPANEGLLGLLMVALYRSGRQAEALTVYTRARQRRVQDLGMEPGGELRRLEHAILNQDPSLAPPANRAKWAGATTQGTPSAEVVPSQDAPPSQQPTAAPQAVGDSKVEGRLVSVAVIQLPTGRGDLEVNAQQRAVLLEHTRAEITRYDGTVADTALGVLAVFGADGSHEDDPERAVRAGLAIAGLAKEVQVGIDRGQALVAGGQVHAGTVVELAARLQRDAPPGGVLVGTAIFEASHRVIDYQPEPDGRGWLALGAKGRIGIGAEASDHMPGAAVLVERETELRLLSRWVDALRVGNPVSQLVTVLGEPGVGKTRLVAELGRQVEQAPELIAWRQSHCARTTGAEQDGQPTAVWGALVEILTAQAGIAPTDPEDTVIRKLREAVDAVIPDPQEAATLAEQLGALVLPRPDATLSGEVGAASAVVNGWVRFIEAVAATRPLVLVIEDAHWADEALLDAIQELLEQAESAALLVVVTARPELLEARPRWGAAVSRTHTALVTLAPLTEHGSRQLLDHLLSQANRSLPAPLRAQVLTQAAGNPLYLEEYVNTLTETAGHVSPEGLLELPATIQQLLTARLDALPPTQQALLGGAAVLGDPIEVEGLAAVCGQSAARVATDLAALARRDLVRRTRPRTLGRQPEYVLRHPLLREVAYTRLPGALRARWHQRAAQWCQNQPDVSGNAEAIAHHYQHALSNSVAAGVDAEQLTTPTRLASRAAGDRTLRLGALQAAARHYTRALTLWPEGEPERTGVLLGLGAALAYGQQAGQEVLAEAKAACQAAGDARGLAQAEALLGHVARVNSQPQQAAAHVRQALTLPVTATPETVEALTGQAIDLLMADQHPQAIRIAGQAQRLARQLGLPEQVANTASIAANARILTGDLAALPDAVQARDHMDTLGVPIAVYAHFGLAHAAWWAGALEQAAAAITRGQQAAETAGAVAAVWIQAVEAGLAYAHGQWAHALALVGQVLGSPQGAYLHPWALVVRSRIHLARDNPEAALADAQTALSQTQAREPDQLGDVRYWQVATAATGRALLATGQTLHATDLVSELLTWVHTQPSRGCVTPDLGWLLLDMDTSPGVLPAGLPATGWHHAAAALADQDLPEAAVRFAALGSPIDEALAKLRHARQLAAAGHASAAAETADQAAVVFRKANATSWLQAAETLSTANPHTP